MISGKAATDDAVVTVSPVASAQGDDVFTPFTVDASTTDGSWAFNYVDKMPMATQFQVSQKGTYSQSETATVILGFDEPTCPAGQIAMNYVCVTNTGVVADYGPDGYFSEVGDGTINMNGTTGTDGLTGASDRLLFGNQVSGYNNGSLGKWRVLAKGNVDAENTTTAYSYQCHNSASACTSGNIAQTASGTSTDVDTNEVLLISDRSYEATSTGYVIYGNQNNEFDPTADSAYRTLLESTSYISDAEKSALVNRPVNGVCQLSSGTKCYGTSGAAGSALSGYTSITG
jgi:hypothetical protein